MTMTMNQALQKMAASSNPAAPVKGQPTGGQPSTAPVNGTAGNVTTTPAGGQPSTAPVKGNSGNATNASGQVMVDTAPEGGSRGKTDKGTLALSKEAGFRFGMRSAHLEKQASLETDAIATSLLQHGVDPSIYSALAELEASGIKVDMPQELTQKIASACEDAGMMTGKKMAPPFAKKEDKKDEKKSDKKDEKKEDEKKA